MDPISSIQNDSSSQANDQVSGDLESFLLLLTSQLKNQDPLDPLDATQFVSQLASFSTVEQLVETNRFLSSISQQQDLQLFSSLIDSEVTLSDDQYMLSGEYPINIPIPPNAPEGATLQVFGKNGQLLDSVPIYTNDTNIIEWTPSADVSGQQLVRFAISTANGSEALKLKNLVTGIFTDGRDLPIELNHAGYVSLDQVQQIN